MVGGTKPFRNFAVIARRPNVSEADEAISSKALHAKPLLPLMFILINLAGVILNGY